ncbi:peptidase S8/S53 domain-containing protein [Dunaliella salina]|uniref:Peptidase S8/S53 domain-containing protein n=1 Tax=Dunaliella salina TaxID=3046 RepID=A0ABQ7GK23_DUNSA|nr:peptidase S8/S53 domain-containing protein [Dunaliella salina]|eukprot:KAF5834967.1 peptidase S8/S53 domain-containing protein [Dunaliella salina]
MLINRFNFADDKEEAEDCDGHAVNHLRWEFNPDDKPLTEQAMQGLQALQKGTKAYQATFLTVLTGFSAFSFGIACSRQFILHALHEGTNVYQSGSISDTVAALDWVALNHKGPSVVIMSLGVSVGAWSRSIEYAVRSLVNEHGITVVVASGNKAMDACHVVPASMGEVLTVAASDMQNKFDANRKEGRETSYRWSNTGHCIDLWAPGVEIWWVNGLLEPSKRSACGGGSRCPNVTDDSYTWASGTSMAVPHVAALAAIYHADHPSARPSTIREMIIRTASSGKVYDSRMLPDTTSNMLFTRSNEVLGGNGWRRAQSFAAGYP